METEALKVCFKECSARNITVCAKAVNGANAHSFYFKSDDIELTPNVEALVTSSLLPCMRIGYDLEAAGTISQRFLDALDTATDIFHFWCPDLRKPEFLSLDPKPEERATHERVGTFFTGGVDSFYTFLKHQEEITDLIFIHGFDLDLGNEAIRTETSEMLKKVEAEFGRRIIEVETNVRSFMDSYADWTRLTHGAALATVGHLLFPHFKRIYFPATHTYDDLFCCGSHPLLDNLWSTEALEFVHDGCEAGRIEKIAAIAEKEIALQNLRVCPKNTRKSYNCGVCNKCIRTMINLHICGKLEECHTFDCRLDLKNVAEMQIYDQGERVFIEENLEVLKNRPQDKALYKALRKALRNKPKRKPLAVLIRIYVYKMVLLLRRFPSAYRVLRLIYNMLATPFRVFAAKAD